MFIKPKIQTNLKDQCTSVWGIRLWNNLEMDYKNSGSWSLFTRMIKDNLLNKYEFV